LLDCDVEEPNCHLFFDTRVQRSEAVCIPVPVLDATKCNGCGLCSQICQFNAVAFMGELPVLFQELCHGCGGCIWVCPTGALSEAGSEIGAVEVAAAGRCTLVQGRLHVGKPLSPPLIRAVKRRAEKDRLTIVDGPPGTACSAVAALTGCDYALLVAEPTRFGLHDLGLAVDTVRQLGIPFGVVVNRASGRSDLVRSYCGQQGIAVLAEIPESVALAQVYARGGIPADEIPELRPLFEALWSRVLAREAA
ncbi:MAG: 4Fe-4S binding protein, partial [Deltaproteobacteria bacterium]|nr:4Fe-4S binding protein [Deltaproteobacteria bacterium]